MISTSPFKNRKKFTSCLSITVILSLACPASGAEPLPLIPKPVSLERTEGSFLLGPETVIRHAPALGAEARLFAADLAKRIGSSPRLLSGAAEAPSQIRLDVHPDSPLPASGYRLDISPGGVSIIGKDAAGAFYGTRTLLQMLPAEKPAGGSAQLPAVNITDHPRFVWRGMMLDVGRHIQPVEDIKKFIDWLAFHKINVMHWHLTEDQGWRIEIKKYPKLTEVGAWRESTPPYGNRDSDNGVRYGGFYTQEQAKEIVAYAAARHITVVPEIDMPGHMSAAIAAYPHLGNDDIPGYAPKVQTRWGIHPYTLAPTEEVFAFIDDMFTEICDIFPSAYIHMGGDEAPKDQWEQSPRVKELMKREGLKDGHEVQSHFVKRVEKILESKNRKLIGWDEIREGGLSPKATVMSWRSEQGGIDSAREGHDVVMATMSHLYFDHYQAPASVELAKGVEYEAIAGFLPIEKVYHYNPVPEVLTDAEAKHVLGVQAQLWSEYMKDYRKVEYMAFPRIAALAEIAWTQPEAKSYPDFLARLEGVIRHYDAAGVNRGEVYADPQRKTKDGSAVETSLGTHEAHWPELAFDGRPDTFFWSDRPPGKNDHFSLNLLQPLTGESKVTVATGGKASEGGDRLEHGVLEVSAGGDGSWTEIGTFRDGKAEGTAPAGTTRIRIRVTAPQQSWLILEEIKIE
jgi:hexosaminidase